MNLTTMVLIKNIIVSYKSKYKDISNLGIFYWVKFKELA